MAKVMKIFWKPSNTTPTMGGQLSRLSCDVSNEMAEKIVKKHKYFFSPEHILWLHTKLYFSWHFQSHHSSLKYCKQSPCPVGFLPPRPQYVKFKTPPSDHFQTPSCILSVPPIHNASFPFIPLSFHFRKMYRFIDCEGTDARFAPLCVHLCSALSQLSIELLQ